MKSVFIYPIYPAPDGALFDIVVGAEFLHVSEVSGHYYIHALVDTSVYANEKRKIAAYYDHQNMPDNCGAYIGSASVSYRYTTKEGLASMFHFFDQTGVPCQT